jgi:nucleotide-binding universal stress UspA family protein
MAQDLDAAIDVVTVVDTSPLEEAYGDVAFRTQRIGEIRAIAHGHATRFARQHFAHVPQAQAHVRDGNTFLEILQAARDLHSDLIIMGTHGRTGIAHLLIGSVAEKVVRASAIPVMTVRTPA